MTHNFAARLMGISDEQHWKLLSLSYGYGAATFSFSLASAPTGFGSFYSFLAVLASVLMGFVGGGLVYLSFMLFFLLRRLWIRMLGRYR